MDVWPKIAFAVILGLLESKKTAQPFKRALFKIYATISAVFADDPEFMALHKRISQ